MAEVAERADERTDPEGTGPGDRDADTSPPAVRATVLVAGLPDAVRERLGTVADLTLVDDPARADAVDLVLVSTRLNRQERARLLDQLADVPVVGVVHAAGEAGAVELMRDGARGIVSEGNEEAVTAFLGGGDPTGDLLEAFVRRFGGPAGNTRPDKDRDPLTGLPGSAAFDQRIEDLRRSQKVPHIAFCRILNLPEPTGNGSDGMYRLLRRRLAIQLRQVAAAYGAELYLLGHTDLATVSEEMSSGEAERLGRDLARLVRTYAPRGDRPLALAMGYAGEEVDADVAVLGELARRALDAACAEPTGGVLSAETLAIGVSSSTELEAALRMVAFIEEHDRYEPGHGERVSAIVGELLPALGVDGVSATRLRVGGLLHDIGKISLPPEAFAPGPDAPADVTEAYRSHPDLGADQLRACWGEEVATAVRHHHERWDGSGFPDGLAGTDIPLGARIIAVADAIDALVCPRDGEMPDLADAVRLLREAAGSRLDPEIVDLGCALLGDGLAGDLPQMAATA